jgi:glycosyltransferase involved in cell wall biosynthesis
MKVALVHDWLTGLRGGERCLQAFLKMYPSADIFTLLHVPGATAPEIDARVKKTSFLQRLPGVARYYRALLPLFPRAVRSFDLRGYDLVISLSHAAAKNVVVPEGTLHLCYCFTPMRYIWDQVRVYFGRLTPLLWPIIRALRSWDRRGSKGVDRFVAISDFVAARIRFFYKRSAEVVYPPVETSWISPAQPGTRGEAFLYAGALVPYKRPDLVVAAFREIDAPLWVVGGGPEEAKLRAIAGPNVTFMGRVSDSELGEYLRRCRALIFPGTEDFGILPLECLAAGRPVIGLYDGALRETLSGLRPWEESRVDGTAPTGVFIPKGRGGEVAAIVEAVKIFCAQEDRFSVEACVAQARCFTPDRFYQSWHRVVQRCVAEQARSAAGVPSPQLTPVGDEAQV